MRGTDDRSEGLFSYLSCDGRVPALHPLRAIRPLVESALVSLSGDFTAIDEKTAREPGYRTSLNIRKLIEEAFGWIKTIGMLRKTRHWGTPRVGWMFSLVATGHNLVRLPKLLARAA